MPRTPPHVTLCFPRVLRAIVVVRMRASHGQKIDKFEGGWTKNRQIFVYRTLREALLNINISTVVRCTQIFTLRESHFSPVG